MPDASGVTKLEFRSEIVHQKNLSTVAIVKELTRFCADDLSLQVFDMLVKSSQLNPDNLRGEMGAGLRS